MNIVQRIEWRLYKERKKRKLKNLTPTIIASNCNGEFIYYDMNLKFRSPTINLSFEMNDYVKMLENLEWYMKQPILPYEDERFEYPTGMLGDIEIRFNHYETLEEGIEKWEERKKRIDWNNLFIMGIDGDDCTYESLKRFETFYPAAGNDHSAVRLTIAELEDVAGACGWIDVCKEILL